MTAPNVPPFDEWFVAPGWLPRDPDSAALVASERLRHRLPRDVLILDDYRRVRLFSENAIVRLEFHETSPGHARFVWRQRYWGGRAGMGYFFFGLGQFLTFKRMFRRDNARDEGDELRRRAFEALRHAPNQKPAMTARIRHKKRAVY